MNRLLAAIILAIAVAILIGTAVGVNFPFGRETATQVDANDSTANDDQLPSETETNTTTSQGQAASPNPTTSPNTTTAQNGTRTAQNGNTTPTRTAPANVPRVQPSPLPTNDDLYGDPADDTTNDPVPALW